MRTRRRPTLLVAAVVALLATSCLDPTTGTPPATGGPAFRSGIETVTASDLHASWRSGCPVGPADLRRVRVSFWGYDGSAHQGQLIVHRDVAPSMVRVFRSLYDHRVQIRRMHPIEVYGGSDDRSMEANNTVGFNCRRVAGTNTWSEHAYGRAVDINPVQNPYVRGSTVIPESGRPWTDRSLRVPGLINPGGPTVRAFAAEGWHWGGNWTSVKDYHHFSQSGR